MRKTDSLGFDRPTITNGNIIQHSMSFPDFVLTTPIRLPRPLLRAESPLYDISIHSDSPLFQRNRTLSPELPNYVLRARTLPNVSRNSGPYNFPDHLSTQHPDEIRMPDTFGRKHVSRQKRKANQHLNGAVTYADRLVTDRLPLPMTSLNEQRQPYFVENVQIPRVQTPHELPSQRHIPDDVANGKILSITEAATADRHSNADDDIKSMSARAIAANPYLGYQRFVFTLTKYPALAMMMVALWNIAGRGESMPKSDSEKAAFYTAITTAAIVLISIVLLSFNHHYLYKRARKLSYLYHLSMVVTFCAAALCIVLASINFKNFVNNISTTTCKYMNDSPCYSNQERIVYLAVLVGCGMILVLFAISTFIYGGIGLSLMKQRLAAEYAKKARERAYNNHGFQY